MKFISKFSLSSRQSTVFLVLIAFAVQRVDACSYVIQPPFYSIKESVPIGHVVISSSQLSGWTERIVSAQLTPSDSFEFLSTPDKQLITKRVFNYDAGDSKTIELRMTVTCEAASAGGSGGGGGASSTKVYELYIRVEDVDDEVPVWNYASPGTIDDNAAKDTLVNFNPPLSFTDKDAEATNQHTVCFADGSSSQLFSVDCSKTIQSGVPVKIVLLKSGQLDFDSTKLYNFTLQVEDRASATQKSMFKVRQDIQIRVIDKDSKLPQFQLANYKGSIPENAVKGDPVNMQPETLQAFDADLALDVPIIYEIETLQLQFSINSSSGVVHLNHNRKSDAPNQYVVLVKAMQTDNAARLTQKLVPISVLPSNVAYQPVKFPANHKSISSSTAENQFGWLLHLNATHDKTSKIFYRLLNYQSIFKISVSTGVLELRETLNFERQSIYQVYVSAYDFKTADNCTIRVAVQDRNDPPAFLQPSYNFQVVKPGSSASSSSSNSLSGSHHDSAGQTSNWRIVGKIEANDEDKHVMTFSLEDNFTGLFKISSQDGVLSVDSDKISAALTSSSTSAFSLRVKVTDSQSASSSVRVSVLFIDSPQKSTKSPGNTARATRTNSFHGANQSLVNQTSASISPTASAVQRLSAGYLAIIIIIPTFILIAIVSILLHVCYHRKDCTKNCMGPDRTGSAQNFSWDSNLSSTVDAQIGDNEYTRDEEYTPHVSGLHDVYSSDHYVRRFSQNPIRFNDQEFVTSK